MSVCRSTGAVAELIDVSCIVYEPEFSTIQNDIFNVWTNLVPASIQSIIELFHIIDIPQILAQHYFVPNPTTGQGLSPKWDFTWSRKGGRGHRPTTISHPLPLRDDVLEVLHSSFNPEREAGTWHSAGKTSSRS